jgi:hypothetical protein
LQFIKLQFAENSLERLLNVIYSVFRTRCPFKHLSSEGHVGCLKPCVKPLSFAEAAMAVQSSEKRSREGTATMGYPKSVPKRHAVLGLVVVAGLYLILNSHMQTTSTVPLAVASVGRPVSFGHKGISSEVKGMSRDVDSQHRFIADVHRAISRPVSKTVASCVLETPLASTFLDTCHRTSLQD